MKFRLLGFLSLLVLVLALTACDGSSGSSSSGSSASGAVAAAPLSEAKVLGYNASGASFEIGETNSKGAIVFDTNALSNVKFPSIVYSVGGKNFDSGTAFSGTLKGVMQSATSAVYLTPATTLVAELVETGMTLDQAEQRVLYVITKEMGLTKVSPFANPLSDLNNSEIVSQTLMVLLGVTEDSADRMLEAVGKIAAKMAEEGKSFTDAVKVIVPSCPLNDADVAGKTLAEVIEMHKSEIVANAMKALGEGNFDQSALEANVVADTTSVLAVALATTVSAEFATAMPAPTATDTSFTVTTSVLSNKVSVAGATLPYSSDNTVNLVVEPAYGTVAIDNAVHTAVYTVSAADLEDVTLPVQITFVLAANADPNLQAVFSFTLEGDTSLAVKYLDFEGNGLYEFTTPEEGKIVDTASKTLLATDFIAQFELVNTFAYNMSDNVDVRFTAPAGFKFNHVVDSETVNTDSFLVNTITDDFKAIVDANTKLVATEEVTPGYKPVGMQVIDKKTGAVLKTASDDLIFIPAGTKQQMTSLALGNSTVNAENKRTISINATHLENNVYDVTNAKADVTALKLVGEFSTWEKESLTDDDTGDVAVHVSPTIDSLYNKGEFFVVTTSKTAQFVVGGTNTDRISIDKSAMTLNEYTVTVDLIGNVAPLKYYPAASGADTLKLVYVPSAGNGEVKASQGGLELDIELP
ncbi:MAG: hypothetical protein ACERJ1_07375 [Halodesulfovibrio sp.]|uniref:hypothetical protein n=1 Tax=Halodesulfovibrio sp. TaxID=1912772 RepID=UPI00359E1D38